MARWMRLPRASSRPPSRMSSVRAIPVPFAISPGTAPMSRNATTAMFVNRPEPPQNPDSRGHRLTWHAYRDARHPKRQLSAVTPLVAAAGRGQFDRDPEDEAAWTVAAFLGGDPRRRDGDGAAPMTHDFDIECAGGRLVALEVTGLTVSEVAQMWAVVERLDWACEGLTESWSISVQAARRGGPGTAIKQFHKEAPPLLAVLEQHHVGRFGDAFAADEAVASPEVADATERLRTLGARS